MAWHPDVSALILAGGKATRLGGIAKHQIVIDGQTILARQLAVLRPRVVEVIVSLPHQAPQPPREAGVDRIVSDRADGIGPLAGVAAGLASCRSTWLLVVAGDMPHLTGELIDRMLVHVEQANVGSGADAVGVRADGLPEPLLCVLHRRVLPILERRIAASRFKASGLLTDEGLAVVWIDDADPRALRNVNSPEDL